MHGLASLLLLGSCAVQSVFGRPDVSQARREGVLLRRAVNDFIAKEEQYAIDHVLCSIGSAGCYSQGVASGLVIASPSKAEPDYWFTWTRDAALVLKAVYERFAHKYDGNLQKEIHNYIISQAKLQAVSNPSGALSDGRGLGEAKYHVDGSAFTGGWGRPQRDGPPLRAITMIGYAKWLIENGYTSTANNLVWPIIRNDIAYTAQYWNQPGFDLWEEVNGNSFFTTAAQYRALIEGSALAKLLGTTCDACDAVAPQVLCYLQTYWSPSRGYVIANLNTNDGRQGKDANVALGSIHNFDPALKCDAATFQPCSDRALANHKVWVDSFRSIYNINAGLPENAAVAVGRYAEDTYYNGNPWYLNTLAAAEQLYDALYVWQTTGSIQVTSVSLAFFKALVPSAAVGTYAASSDTYKTIYDAVFLYADGFVDKVSQYAYTNGSLAEQFDRNTGAPASARDLTWSYASFLTAVARRAGVVPRGWAGANPTVTSVPGSCFVTTRGGSYSSVSVTAFPPDQTPNATPTTPIEFTTPTLTVTRAPPGGGCPGVSTVSVAFTVRKTTIYGQTVKIVGNTDRLGNWDPNRAVALSASQYSQGNPIWSGTIPLAPGQAIQYKYIVINTDGSVSWEADPNRFYTIPSGCVSTASKQDSWQ